MCCVFISRELVLKPAATQGTAFLSEGLSIAGFLNLGYLSPRGVHEKFQGMQIIAYGSGNYGSRVWGLNSVNVKPKSVN